MIREDYLREGKLTAFTGIPFDSEHPYTYLEAKRLLKLIIEELKGDKGFIGKVGVDKTSPGRPAITGRESTGVWDFLRMARVGGPHTFTRYPHLTVAVGVDHMEADVTLPNGVPEKTRTRVLGEDLEVFEQRMAQVLSNMRGVIRSDDSVRPVVKVLQRHYATQRSLLTRDALIYCDLRTAFRSKRKSAHKYQPEWLRTIYNVMMHKRSNLQFQVGVEIPYIHSTVIKTPRATKLIADAFLALRPLLGRCSSR
ncbi:MAG: hypothetical protein JSU70_18040 [Phycisphaerales bacterium]|nr:MAG: hypothetical protein JSU70_18040 [Phycisphaerales bacterium]